MFVLYIKKQNKNRLAHIVEASGAGDVLYMSSQVSSMSCLSHNHCKCTCCSVYSLGLLFFPLLGPHFFSLFWAGIPTQLRWNLHQCKAFRISFRQLGRKVIRSTRHAQCWHHKKKKKKCKRGAEGIDTCSALGCGTSTPLATRPGWSISYNELPTCKLQLITLL